MAEMNEERANQIIDTVTRCAEPLGLYLEGGTISYEQRDPALPASPYMVGTFTLGDRALRPVVQDPEQETYDRMLEGIETDNDTEESIDLLQNWDWDDDDEG